MRRAILIAVLASVPAGSARGGQLPSQPANGVATSTTVEELLQHPDVQKELKLSSQQMQLINQITREVQERHKEEFKKLLDLGLEERRRKQADLAKMVSQETRSALGNVLESGQAKRLEQIHWQQQGLRAFADPKIQKVLRLTNEQKNKLKTITEDAAKEIRWLFGPRAQSNFQEALQKVEKVRRKAIDQCIALLTDEQKTAWRELIGEPFQLQSEPPRIRPPGRGPDKPAGSKP